MNLAFLNARIVTPFRVIERGTLVTDGSLISGIGEADEVAIPRGSTAIDCAGMWLTPGFVDLLVHGGGGHGFADQDPGRLHEISGYFFRHGTTGLLAALYSKPEREMVADVRRIASFVKSAPRSNVWGIHLEGPFINAEFHGAMKQDYLWKPDLHSWERLYEASEGTIRLMTIAPELPGVDAVMRAAARQGVVLSIGHSAASYHDVLNAIDNGAAHVTHMFNAMPVFHHRKPGVVLGALLHDELKLELIADGIHVHPAVMKLLYNIKGEGGIVLITDAIRASGMSDGEYSFMDQTITVRDKKAYLPDGTLAGSTVTMEQAIKTMVRQVDVPMTKAVRMASFNGAKVLGLSHRKGILAVGKDADVVILSDDLDVRMTVFEGEVKFSNL